MTDVLVRRDGGVATIAINNPARLNCLGRAQITAFIDAVTELADDPGLRVLIVTGEGDRAFMGGANLHELGALNPPRARDFLTQIHRMCKVLRDLPVPVIARVNGHARAGGIGLIAAADMAVAAEAATFAFTEVRVGVAPAMILVPALRVVDHRFLARTTLTGERFSASEAAAAGLLTAVTPDETALDAWVAEQTTALRQAAPGAVRSTRTIRT